MLESLEALPKIIAKKDSSSYKDFTLKIVLGVPFEQVALDCDIDVDYEELTFKNELYAIAAARNVDVRPSISLSFVLFFLSLILV